jgi:DNA adenine methylase
LPRPAPAIRQPLKWAGGKFYLSRWIHSLAPPHTHRVIGYGGGLGELWNWPHAGVSEVVNDLNGYLINFYRVLQSDKLFAEFRRRVAAVPFARVEWTDAHKAMTALIDKTAPAAYRPGTPDVTVALLFFVWNRQSMGGRMDTFSSICR